MSDPITPIIQDSNPLERNTQTNLLKRLLVPFKENYFSNFSEIWYSSGKTVYKRLPHLQQKVDSIIEFSD